MKQLFTFLSILFFTSFVNATPVVTVIKTNTPVCNNGYNTTFYKVAVSGVGTPYVNTLTSSDNTVMDGGALWYTTSVVAGVSYFEFMGAPTGLGSFFLTVDFSDGYGNQLFTGSPIQVTTGTPPSFISNPISLCTSQGTVNLNDYVTSPGYNFQSSDFEYTFEDGLLNTGDSPLSYSDPTTISYESVIGNCTYLVEGTIVLNQSADLDIGVTSTDCNTTDGSAELFAGGDDLPFTIVWTTGQQNVNTIANLAPGAYAVEVTTAHGCSGTLPFTVETNGLDIGYENNNVTCYGGNDGSIEIFPDGLVAPLNVIWSSGQSTLSISDLTAGYYTVNIKDINNCVFIKNIEIYQPDMMTLETSVNFPVCGEENGDVTVTNEYGGTTPFTYEWTTGSVENYIEDIGYGIYSVTATDQNGCIQVKTFYVSEEGGPTLTGDITGSSCGSADGSIITYSTPASGTEIASVLWSNGETTPDVYELAPDMYICTLTGSDGCRTTKSWTIPAEKPLQNNICVVTVDDLTTTNLVVWEKEQTEGIGYYKIYRETSQIGYYALIDTVNFTNESVFNDVVASPLERSWKYKISAVNTCNEEGPMSLPHQTIHLNVLENSTSGGVTVGWNAYSGTAFNNYFISRYTNQNGWEELATLPVTQLSYEDTMPITTPGLDYVVEMELTTPCTADKAQDFNSSRSNKDKAQFNPGQGTGDSNNSIGEDYLNEVTVSPNPAVDKLFITQNQNTRLEVTIMTMAGQKMQTEIVAGQTGTIDVSNLAPGVYVVNISLNGIVKNLRVIKL